MSNVLKHKSVSGQPAVPGLIAGPQWDEEHLFSGGVAVGNPLIWDPNQTDKVSFVPGVQIGYGTVDSISGQNNLISHKLTPTSSGAIQQLGLWIDMQTTNVIGNNGLYRIPLAIRVQTGGGTGAGTGEGMRVINPILQFNSADSNTNGFIAECGINNNKVDDGANPAVSVVKGGISVVSSGSQPITAGFLVAGTGKSYHGLWVQGSSIKSPGYAFRYSGDGSGGSAGLVNITSDGRLVLGFESSIGNPGDILLYNNKNIQFLNNALNTLVAALSVNTSDQVVIASGGADVKWGKALVSLGGGAAPTFGTIGGSGPATAAQNSWMRVIDSTGAAYWVPAWK